ncbi:alpha/beta fold hydrolase [Nocardia sp. NPDC059228]|uniref:alpha/beta fold hydrolase n=1 Tax=Nocardia sp. NPDC059228 TaxID=3346777 RepID=UPI00368629C5
MTERLLAQGIPVLVPPVYNRSLSADAASIRAVAEAIDGPVLLAGHSYGGAVITVVDTLKQPPLGLCGGRAGVADNVAGLVYVSGYALEEGESLGQLQGGAPDSDLAANLVYTPSGEQSSLLPRCRRNLLPGGIVNHFGGERDCRAGRDRT